MNKQKISELKNNYHINQGLGITVIMKINKKLIIIKKVTD